MTVDDVSSTACSTFLTFQPPSVSTPHELRISFKLLNSAYASPSFKIRGVLTLGDRATRASPFACTPLRKHPPLNIGFLLNPETVLKPAHILNPGVAYARGGLGTFACPSNVESFNDIPESFKSRDLPPCVSTPLNCIPI